MPTYVVRLTDPERHQLEQMLAKGRHAAAKAVRARILLKADQGEAGPGWKDGDIVAALDTSLSTVHRVRQAFVEQGLDAALSRRKPAGRQYRKLDGAQEARLAALYEQEQTHTRELERAYAELHHAETLRDDLTDMIIHDLRGPLTVIMVNLELIGQTLTRLSATESISSLANARTAARRVAWMIDDLLNVSKLEAGRLQLNLTPLAAADWLAEKQEVYRTQLDAKQITLALHIPAKLPLTWVDIDLINRVLDNLIDNALKYTPRGGHIDITAEAKGQMLILTVQDDGEGIHPDERERIFEKFTRGTSSEAPVTRQGAGLGLAFCRLAVVAHGGTITADGAPGRGTIFTVTLPIDR